MLISMREFVETGSLGPVSLGSSRAEVEAAFGLPQAGSSDTIGYGGPVAPLGEAVWVYGGVELQWYGPLLWMIDFDDFDSPCAWIDPWILQDSLSLERAEQELQAANIQYSQVAVPNRPGHIHLCATSGVRLHFVPQENGALELGSCSIRRGASTWSSL